MTCLPLGSVSYSYQIGKYAVTTTQYAEFLNAVASTDTYGAYNEQMATNLMEDCLLLAGCGRGEIDRIGESGSYLYLVKNGTGNRPITWVSWFNAARFANWMSNGKPSGAQNSTTTENGAYNVNNSNGFILAVSVNTINPNTGLAPKFRIPTQDEWYKAGYYSPNYGGIGVGGYYLYANESDSSPNITTDPTINPITDVGLF